MLMLKLYVILYLLTGTGKPINTLPQLHSTPNVSGRLNQCKCISNTSMVTKKSYAVEVQHGNTLIFINESEQKLMFLLHGKELFQLFIENFGERITYVGSLASNGQSMDMGPLGASVIKWHNYILVAVAYENFVEIYQISQTYIKKYNESVKNYSNSINVKFEFIQQLAVLGKLREMYFVKPTPDKVLFLVTVSYTKFYAKLRSFVWIDSYLNPVDEIDLPAIHSLYVIGSHRKYIVIAKPLQQTNAKIILTTYEIRMPTMTLIVSQVLTISARNVFAANFRGNSYIIACRSKQNSFFLFLMVNGQFVLYEKRSFAELFFDKVAVGNELIVATYQHKILIFENEQLDCCIAFKISTCVPTNLYAIANHENEAFALLEYKAINKTVFNIVSIERHKPTLLNSPFIERKDNKMHQVSHRFEGNINKLRSILLKRRSVLDTYRFMLNLIISSETNLNSSVVILKSFIRNINLISRHLRSPTQLFIRVQQINHNLRSRRFIRSFEPKRLKARCMRVNYLMYNKSLLVDYYLEKLGKLTSILSIKQTLTTNLLRVNKLFTRQYYNFTGSYNQYFHRVHVQHINTVSLFELYKNILFKQDSNIVGRMIFQSDVKIITLSAVLLNGWIVPHLFNIKKSQLIRSNIFISSFFVSHVVAKLINDLIFDKDIIFRRYDILIEVPVKFNRISIYNNISFGYISAITQDLTQVTKLKQYYTNKIYLFGGLAVKNLFREVDMTAIYVNDSTYSVFMFKKQCLTMKSPQMFKDPVLFNNSKVSTRYLKTDYFSKHNATEYLVSHRKNLLREPLFIILLHARVNGDIGCTDYTTKLNLLQHIYINRTNFVYIAGSKLFITALIINEVITNSLKYLTVQDFVPRSTIKKLDFRSTKFVEIVFGNEEAWAESKLNASLLNEILIKELLNCDLYLNRLTALHKLKAFNFLFLKINGVFYDYALKYLIRNETLVVKNDLQIYGDVDFGNLKVNLINNIEWQIYKRNIVRSSENTYIEGKKVFLLDIRIIAGLNTVMINTNAIDTFLDNTLLHLGAQIVSACYTFSMLKIMNVNAWHINNISKTSLIKTTLSRNKIELDLFALKLKITANMMGLLYDSSISHDFIKNLLELELEKWNKLVVVDNAKNLPINAVPKLNFLWKNAVTHSGKQIVTGSVVLKQLIIIYMKTETQFLIRNGLSFIAKDALLKDLNISFSTINTIKTFHKSLQFNFFETLIDIKVPAVERIHIKLLNESLYRHCSNDLISDIFNFITYPVINHIAVEGTLNNLDCTEIYGHINMGFLQGIALNKLISEGKATFDDVNSMSLNYLLENRVLLYSEALEIFGELKCKSLIINERFLFLSINDILVDNFVLKKYEKFQPITATKYIGNVILLGPVHVKCLNTRLLSQTYQFAIFAHKSYTTDNVIIKYLVRKTNLGYLDKIVGSSRQHEMEKIWNTVNKLNWLIKSILKIYNINHLKYFDYYQDFDTCNSSEIENYNYNIDNHEFYCQWRFLQLVQSSQNRVFLKFITTNLIMSLSGRLKVTIEIFCNLKLKTKITISCLDLSKFIVMKKFVRNAKIYALNNTYYFVLLYVADIENNCNEIRVLKVNYVECKISDWQSFKLNAVSDVWFFTFLKDVFLITKEIIKDHSSVFIYTYEPDSEQFKLHQTIDGYYDIIEFIKLSDIEYQLLLSCKHCQCINIYLQKLDSQQSFNIFQILKISMRISKLSCLKLNGLNSHYLLVLSETQQHYFYLFKYSSVKGWIKAYNGYFKYVQLAVPLPKIDDANNILLRNSEQFSFMKIYLL